MEKEIFPDGTPVDDWFYNTDAPKLCDLGTQYNVTDYGVFSDGKIYTKEIQNVIDTAYENGGGVVVIPEGTYMSGSLYFKRGVNLYIKAGGTLKGSDDISDYRLCETRIEGQVCKYYEALVNADGTDGFTVCGEGTIDGNGIKAWRAFLLRYSWNPDCTNKDEQRPRLVYVSNCTNVTIAGLNLQNSHFWTNHFYKCSHVKVLNCNIFSPKEPVQAPSTDALDFDVCTDVLVKGCRISVNDDAVALKGGKGPWADKQPENGMNERVIIEDCDFGFCHACITCGSESVHNRNVIARRLTVHEAGYNFLRLKMRPDTPQLYEYILIEDAHGKTGSFINVNPWTQFYDLEDREDIPLSYARHITMRGCDFECERFFDVTPDDTQYELSDFVFENLNIKAEDMSFDTSCVENMTVKNVNVRN